MCLQGQTGQQSKDKQTSRLPTNPRMTDGEGKKPLKLNKRLRFRVLGVVSAQHHTPFDNVAEPVSAVGDNPMGVLMSLLEVMNI